MLLVATAASAVARRHRRRSIAGNLYVGFFPNAYAIPIPNAYSPIIGSASAVCVTMSGVGVTIAAMMNAPTMANLNF